MEVHHHAHTERKKWIHYFWEFLMLFLAVSLGFLVENQREHFIEKQRSKELVKSLVIDLKTDTSRLHRTIIERQNKVIILDSLLSRLTGTDMPKDIQSVYQYTYDVIYKIQFRRADGTISQLKNAGYLRYFSNSDVPIQLMAYDEVIDNLTEFEKTYSNNLDNFVALVFRHFDADVFNRSWADFRNRQPIPENVVLYDMSRVNLNTFKSTAVSLKHLNLVNILILNQAETKALETIEVLRQEYKVD
jgi:hypothetical protein